jgi:beta-lactam-binding protein with PASTA domain
MGESQAASVLQRAGFNVVIFPNAPEPSGQPRGTVFKQSPLAGTLLTRGSTIRIYG